MSDLTKEFVIVTNDSEEAKPKVCWFFDKIFVSFKDAERSIDGKVLVFFAKCNNN